MGVSYQIKKTVCSLFRCKSDKLAFKIMNVMRQTNSYDCGLHAIACVTALAHDRDPTGCRWAIEKMRGHFQSCLENAKMTCFPMVEKRRAQMVLCVRKTIVEKMYCTCRQINVSSRPMIRCDKCLKWYHKDCMGLDVTLCYTSIEWKCNV